MPPISSRLFNIVETNVLSQAIGKVRAVPSLSRSSSTGTCTQQVTKQAAKHKSSNWDRQRYGKTRQFASSNRVRRTWEQLNRAGIATEAKRSDTRPLLGVLFGASALAYLGSSVFAPADVQEQSNKTSEDVNITNVEGKCELLGSLGPTAPFYSYSATD